MHGDQEAAWPPKRREATPALRQGRASLSLMLPWAANMPGSTVFATKRTDASPMPNWRPGVLAAGRGKITVVHQPVPTALGFTGPVLNRVASPPTAQPSWLMSTIEEIASRKSST